MPVETYFNPHLPCGRWHLLPSIHLEVMQISIHTFLAEGDADNHQRAVCNWISIHTFLAEGDGPASTPCQWQKNFNPHLPCGRWRSGRIDRRCRDCTFQSTPSLRKVTLVQGKLDRQAQDFNPHLPCGRWHFVQIFTANVSSISIHTFLAEGDGEYRLCHYIQGDFNPHLPCGRWQHLPIPRLLQIGFQSTPSLRKVTIYFFNHFWNGVYFNPHLPCGRWRLLPIWPPDISNFNPHLPCGRWRKITNQALYKDWISIHTFLAEGDAYSSGM